jgi:hypothetical protein
MEQMPAKGEHKQAFRLELGKSLIGCLSAIVVACISGTVALVTNWDKLEKMFSNISTSQVLFQDEFSDPTSGWDRYSDPEGSLSDYADGNYRILVNEPDVDITSNPGKSFSDVAIKVTVQKHGGPDDNVFGVICRFQDVDNFYELVLSSDGYYGIGRMLNGEFTWMNAEEMQTSDQIHTGSLTNLIQAECVKTRLTLYANGHKLAEVNDKMLPQSGDIGLMAGAYKEAGVDIYFDHLTVKKP